MAKKEKWIRSGLPASGWTPERSGTIKKARIVEKPHLPVAGSEKKEVPSARFPEAKKRTFASAKKRPETSRRSITEGQGEGSGE